MNCPRCEGAALEERERDGVVIDVCRACRGLWLDRGELEKLVARATQEFDELARRRDDIPPRGVRYHDDDDDHYHHRDPRRKRRWFESLGDIFD
jgi:Zn-finger nucleic acid-binding protein